MKTTEENARAIDIVKQMIVDGQVSQEVAEKYFPELKESEDEKIREKLIDTFNFYDPAMNSHTDLPQSKKLAEFLPIESADHHYVRKVCDFMGNAIDEEWSFPKYGNINSKYAKYVVQNFTRYEKVPCWSLAALLDVIPFPQLSKDKLGCGMVGWMVSIYPNDCRYDSCWHDNPIDACVEMIEKLHKQMIYDFNNS